MPDFNQNPAFVFYFKPEFSFRFMYTKHSSNLKRACFPFILIGWFLTLGSASAGANEDLHQLAQRAQLKLNALHNPEAELHKVKKFELLLSDEGFLRYRRTFINGKQEYYSLNLTRIRTIDYLGDTASGELSIQTQEDDVIVQTFNDRTGNVDSMATHFRLPLSRVEAEDLVVLQDDLLEMKRQLQRK
ncbi:MAG: hypothetical protein WC220_05890 [Pedobacter sp.]|jgi:hypothetical protein